MSWTRREHSTTRCAGALPGPRGSGTNAGSYYEGRVLVAQPSTFEARTDGAPAASVAIAATRRSRPARRPSTSLTSPGLLVLAALAVLEGYRQLQLIPSADWHPSAYLFATGAPVLALVVTWPYRVKSRGPGQRVAVGAAAALAVITPVAMLFDRPHAGVVVGVSDMTLAAIALGAVLAGERLLRWSRPDLSGAGETEPPRR